jgi:Trk K+ transport system NAD-binding subunit
MGWRVLDFLHEARLPVVVVDTHCRPDDPRLRGATLIEGDCRQREVLEAAGVRTARGVLLLTRDDLVNIATALAVRALNADVRVVLRMFNQNLLARLGKAVKNVHALSTSLLTAPILALTALTGQGLGRVRLEGPTETNREVIEVTLAPGSVLEGRSLLDLVSARDLQVLVHRSAGGQTRYLLQVDLEARLQVGDSLVVCGATPSVQTLAADCATDNAPDLHWASRLRRLIRVAGSAFRMLDPAVTLCTLVLLVVVATGTLVLHFSANNYTVADALYRTVSIMATGADMREKDYPSGATKVFVSLLRLVGLALTAAFTAIITHYLIRSRLGSALEVRRIPDAGHVVICGLSPMGFRVLEELVQARQPTVVIDLNANNRFVSTARRLGAAVVLGDATVSEVLRQAKARSARAVVAATNNDLVNLEVALLVRELNPVQRVVVLQSEPQLAQALRDAADVRLAVSVPALAAPAFVARLFGDRVQGVLLIHDHLFMVIDLVVQDADPFFEGQSVRTIAVDYQLLPVALLHAEGPPARHPLNARLKAGDRLVGILALPDLERLLRRQPAARPYAVEVMRCPIPTRGWLLGLVRTVQGVGGAEAEALLERMPFRLAGKLSRGQAEDLLATLLRERVDARMVDGEGGG